MNDLNYSGGYTPDGGDDIQRPSGRYDNIVLWIERFPLRIFVVLFGCSMLLRLAGSIDHMMGAQALYATLGYIVGFFVVLAELVLGKVTRLIKDILLRIVIRAERNADVL